MFPAKCANLSKVIVSLPNETEDWQFLNENYELIQNSILNQIRIIKRGQILPIYTEIRNNPLLIKIEEFGGYQSPDMLGIISNDTELVVIDNNDQVQAMEDHHDYLPPLIAVPTSEFYFSCHPSHKLPQICSFQDETFGVSKCESVPINVLLIPDVILSKHFKTAPKDKITLSRRVEASKSFTGTYQYNIDGKLCNFEPDEHLNKSIISTSGGIVITTSKIDFDQINQIRPFCSAPNNNFTKYLLKTSHKITLFHGQAGSGKTRMAHESLQQLNYNPEYLSKIEYVDLLTSGLNTDFPDDTPFTLIADHVDEYLQHGEDMDEKGIIKYIILCRKIVHFLGTCKENRVILISRSSKIFSKFSSIASLQFDHIFTFEESQNWSFNINTEPLSGILGLSEAIDSLERFILNPLQFSCVYKANQMDVHSR